MLTYALYSHCLQSAVHAGQVKVPPGYHPIDVEKEWGRLHVAILERERLLRIEFERLADMADMYSYTFFIVNTI